MIGMNCGVWLTGAGDPLTQVRVAVGFTGYPGGHLRFLASCLGERVVEFVPL
jgi:hypothetical protein